MRPIRSLLIFLLVVFVGGALLAPWLYWLVRFVAPASHLARNPFHRFVDRSLLALAILGIWPLLHSLGAKSWREVGLVKTGGEWQRLLAGFALGFVSLACVAIIVLTAHGRRLDPNLTFGRFCEGIIGASATALVVAVLEELLFRGAIFGALRKVWNWRAALLTSSVIYALTHFMQPADLPGAITWHSGLEILERMLSGSGDLTTAVPAFFNLTLAGILLGLAYQKTGNLYFSIGLHAGWIFSLKSYGLLTTTMASTNQWIWGTEKLIDGWLALIILVLTWITLVRLPLANAEETVP